MGSFYTSGTPIKRLATPLSKIVKLLVIFDRRQSLTADFARKTVSIPVQPIPMHADSSLIIINVKTFHF
jgi:hypothetical protein